MMNSKELVENKGKTLDDKKGVDIEVIKTEELTIVADYFVIATANSNTHLRSLSEEVEYRLSLENIKPDHIEGRATGWVVLQYAGVTVHLFLKDTRSYYNLERLWGDGAKIDISDIITD